jgi:hypothetical protein
LWSLEAPQQKTAGRKVFVGVCDAINLVIPLEINREATSMRDSGLANLTELYRGKRIHPFRFPAGRYQDSF